MARLKELDIDLAADDADGLADNNDSSSAGSITLDGALTSGGTWTASDVGISRVIEIKDASTTDQSGATFTITGTDHLGQTSTEAVTGPGSGATVKSTKAWSYISDITVASPASGSPTVDIGPANETSSGFRIIPLNYKSPNAARISVDVTGTINFTVGETYDKRDNLANAVFTDISALADKTADTTSTAAANATALKVEVNSYSDTAEMQVTIIQADNN